MVIPQEYYLLIFFLLWRPCDSGINLLLVFFLGDEKGTTSFQRNLFFSECQIGKGEYGLRAALFAEWWTKYFFSKNANKNRKTLKWIGVGVGWIDLWYLNYPGHIYEFFTGQIIVPISSTFALFFIYPFLLSLIYKSN